MSKCLLVVDMQEITVGKQHADFFNYSTEIIDNVNKIIKEYDVDNVIYIVNLMKDNLISKFAPFKAFKGTKEVELAKELDIVNDNIIEKYKGNAFTNPKLNKLLQQKNCDEVEIVGVDGGGCVANTAFGALENGYKVTIQKAAVGTMFIKKSEKYNMQLLDKGVKFI